MSTANISSMTARNKIFLEPSRILHSMVSSIVEDIVQTLSFRSEMLPVQAQKWINFAEIAGIFIKAIPIHDSN